MGLAVAHDGALRDLGLRPQPIADLIETAESWYRDLAHDAGLQLAIFKAGQLVLSLWSGLDAFTKTKIRRDTLFPLLSATKGIASAVLLHLHHLGYFEWQDPIVRYWPRFGRNGKATATIEHLLAHQLGLPYLTADWRKWPDRAYMTNLVEEAEPAWPPGESYGYHGGSWGIVVDELVRLWTQCETGEILRDALVGVTGAENCYIGLPHDRYADVARLLYLETEQRTGNPPLAPIGADQDYNSLHVLRSCQSSGGGVASAEHLAALYALIANEGRAVDKCLWSPEEQSAATTARNDPTREAPAARHEIRFAWGLGFMVSPSQAVFGSIPLSARTAGHPGASGAIGYADPDHRVSVAFTINGVGGRRMYERYQQLGDLVRSAVSCSD